MKNKYKPWTAKNYKQMVIAQLADHLHHGHIDTLGDKLDILEAEEELGTRAEILNQVKGYCVRNLMSYPDIQA